MSLVRQFTARVAIPTEAKAPVQVFVDPQKRLLYLEATSDESMGAAEAAIERLLRAGLDSLGRP